MLNSLKKHSFTKLLLISCLLLLFVSSCNSQTQSESNVIQITVSEETANLWNEWNGKYVLYANKDANLSEIGDLDGMTLLVAYIESEEILDDATQLFDAEDIVLSTGIQNNPEYYKGQLVGEVDRIGIMAPIVAEEFDLANESSMVQIELIP